MRFTINHIQARKRSLFTFFLMAFLSAFAPIPLAQCANLFGNLPQTNDSGSTAAVANNQQAALIFTTGSSAINVSDIVLRLGMYNTNEPQADVALIGLFNDNGSGTNIGTQVGSYLVAPPSVDTAINNFTFSAAGSLELAANTKYWLVLNANPSSFGFFLWEGSNPASVPTGTGISYNSSFYSTTGGSSWNPYSPARIPSFQINGTIVPEPSLPLTTFAIVMFGLLRPRRAVTVT